MWWNTSTASLLMFSLHIEGKVGQHGDTYRRTWRKVHLGSDEASGAIVAAVVTTNNYSDSRLLPDLLEQVEEELIPSGGRWGLC